MQPCITDDKLSIESELPANSLACLVHPRGRDDGLSADSIGHQSNRFVGAPFTDVVENSLCLARDQVGASVKKFFQPPRPADQTLVPQHPQSNCRFGP